MRWLCFLIILPVGFYTASLGNYLYPKNRLSGWGVYFLATLSVLLPLLSLLKN